MCLRMFLFGRLWTENFGLNFKKKEKNSQTTIMKIVYGPIRTWVWLMFGKNLRWIFLIQRIHDDDAVVAVEQGSTPGNH